MHASATGPPVVVSVDSPVPSLVAGSVVVGLLVTVLVAVVIGSVVVDSVDASVVSSLLPADASSSEDDVPHARTSDTSVQEIAVHRVAMSR
jgi:hypothetical protein